MASEITKKTLTFCLFRTDPYGDNNSPPESAAEFIAWLQALINSVPAEHRVSVQIEVGDDGDYDRPRPELTVSWRREETDEEFAARIADDAARKEERSKSYHQQQINQLAQAMENLGLQAAEIVDGKTIKLTHYGSGP